MIMGIIGNLIGIFASPIIEGYAEYRKWQIAEQALTSLSTGIGNRVDQTFNSAGILAGRTYARLENGVSAWLNDSSQYLKLFAASGSFQLISGAAKVTSLAGGCFLSNSLSCTTIDIAASACSAYSALAASVLAYKLGIDFYRFWKSSNPDPSIARTDLSQKQPPGRALLQNEANGISETDSNNPSLEEQPPPNLTHQTEIPLLDNLSQEEFDAVCLSLVQKLDRNRSTRNQLHSRAEESRKSLKQKA